MTAAQFAARLIAWQQQYGRKDLPWQQQVTPYRVWVSEIMLQQTQVASVIGYFGRFIAALPNVQTLAAANDDEVLHLWTGLGYYSRARNLKKTAQIISSQLGGEFPASVKALVELPGIGRSTAGAILSLGMGLPAAILDGNVKRVLARYAAIDGWPGESKTAAMLWELAERFTPTHQTATYNQAMMDLGATVCTRSQPSCEQCPVQSGCRAWAAGSQSLYPTPKPRKTLPQKHSLMPIFTRADGCILLERRPPAGIWGGLWSLPELNDINALEPLAQRYALDLGKRRALSPISHTFSHFRLAIEPWLIEVQESAHSVAENNWLWYDPNNPKRLGLAAPVVKLLKYAAKIHPRNI